MEEEREKIEYLGPIDPFNILDNEVILVDPKSDEYYTNLQPKLGLEEKKDFYIINQEFWEYLYGIYGGVPIERPTYRKSEDSMNVSVEVWLQKVTLFLKLYKAFIKILENNERISSLFWC